jgi:hypothetical protein
MDGAPLDIAYTLARKADMATQKGDYSNASTLHARASEKFTEAIAFTNSFPAQTMLDSLSKSHLARSKFLADKNNLVTADTGRDMGRAVTGGANGGREELVSSLASARGIRPIPTHSNKKEEWTGDPIQKAYTVINGSFTKTLNSLMSEKGEGSLGETVRTNESFYVVPAATKNHTAEELSIENANLRQMLNRTSTQLYAYETAMRKHKEILKTTLMQVKAEIASKENLRNKQYELELEQFRTENDKLKIQIGRLKSRWDSLKESARKKREEELE